ncbi:FmdB family zinc ribbon protein [Brevibacterium gallinarum]|uniref:FmdB family transcriptional regulator n=1 Tax=Brevibacterium gallinarum TaxID=2762220 RepID=A0ABR8WXZ9_9MICO|nr:FmdB family zinc ribbon protein [Brevibacterium gallinarum]MBD8021551.1 FmdB family transcriptional regulator [Brevibacterium gallinarum]
MPTYAYRCTECSNAFDIHQAFTDDALTECPQCRGRLRKVFGSIGVSFKGSGFYRNDHGATAGSGSASSGSAGSAGGDSGSSSASSADSSASSADSSASSSNSVASTASAGASSSTASSKTAATSAS